MNCFRRFVPDEFVECGHIEAVRSFDVGEDDFLELPIKVGFFDSAELGTDCLQKPLRDVLDKLWLLLVHRFFQSTGNRGIAFERDSGLEVLGLIFLGLPEVVAAQEGEVLVLAGVREQADDIRERTLALSFISDDRDKSGIRVPRRGRNGRGRTTADSLGCA